MLSRRRSKTLVSLLAVASVGTLAASSVSATTEPPGTEPAGTEAAGTEAAGTEAAGSGGVGEVGGSACGTPHGPWDDPGEPSGEVRVAWNDPPLSFNNNTIHANALAVTNVKYLMNAGFSFYDADVQLINDDTFGTCTLDSLDPLTITYRINEGVTWSDGVQVDAADMLMLLRRVEHPVERRRHGHDVRGHDRCRRRQTVRRSWSARTAPRSRRPMPRPTAPRSTRRPAARRGLHLQGVHGRRVRRLERGVGARHPEAGDLRGRPRADADVRQLLRRLPVQHAVADGGRRTSWSAVALGIDDPAAGKQALIDAFMNRRCRGTALDRRGLEHGLRRRRAAGRSGSVPEQRRLQPHGLHAAHRADVRSPRGRHVGPADADPDHRLQDHRRPGRCGPGDGERGSRHHPAAVDE